MSRYKNTTKIGEKQENSELKFAFYVNLCYNIPNRELPKPRIKYYIGGPYYG